MKKYLILIIILIIMSCQSASVKQATHEEDETFRKIAEEISSAVDRLPNKTVAVYGFEFIGRSDDSYSKYATEKLTHELVKAKKLLVIERSSIDKVIEEQEFSLSGSVDAASAAKLGKILSVDAVVIGKIRMTSDKVEFITRIIQSERGIILASSNQYFNIEKKQSDTTTEVKNQSPTEYKNSEGLSIYIAKSTYSPGEQIVVNFDGMSGSIYDWITLVKKSKSDSTYGQYFYTNGKKSGKMIFDGLSQGEYEIRAYYNWPKGSYIVKGRLAISVK